MSRPATQLPPISENKQRKSAQTKQAIVTAARDFLWNKPFRELTVRELMSVTGTSRPAFYQYFSNLHRLMEHLLEELKNEILVAASPWFSGVGDPVESLDRSLEGLVYVCYQNGPFVRAILEAVTMDSELESAWNKFISGFDQAVCEKIQQDQAVGLIPEMDAMQVSVSLNRMDVGVTVKNFGQLPRSNPDKVAESLKRIWKLTLYGRLS